VSGIAGFYYLDGRQAERSTLEHMLGTIGHRGPLRGSWVKGSVGLGCRALPVTAEARCECLPLTDPSRSMVLTADARIDNRDELRAALGHLPSAIGDTHLILLAYQRWGSDCPSRLVGDYAFVIWDGEKRRLFCARDHIGVKPFYYFRSPRIFVFASEIKALLALDEVPREINEVKVGELLARHFEDKAGTLYRGIYRLPPAHSQAVTRDACSVRAYWSLDPTFELRLKNDAAYEEAFRELFVETVRCRTRAEGPVGATLSGGLDSSSITCVASGLLDRTGAGPLHTFSAIFSGLPEKDRARSDEQEYISAVLDWTGYPEDRKVVPHLVRADRLSPLRDLDKILWHQDEAFLAPNLYMHWSLYEAASQHGVRVFLDGIDGDATVSHGLDYLPYLARTFRWRRLMKEAEAFCRRPEVLLTPLKVALRFGVNPLIPAFATRLWQCLRGHRKRPTHDPRSIVDPGFARRISLNQRIREGSPTRLDRLRSLRKQHRASLQSGLIPLGLEVLDKAAAAFGLEPRYPFFDRRLMELCVALPAEQKLANGWTRSIQRRAMADILPESVRWRFSKADLSPAFEQGLLNRERPTLDHYLDDQPGLLAPYVDFAALRAAYREYRSHPTAAHDEALSVYAAVMLAIWINLQANLTRP